MKSSRRGFFGLLSTAAAAASIPTKDKLPAPRPIPAPKVEKILCGPGVAKTSAYILWGYYTTLPDDFMIPPQTSVIVNGKLYSNPSLDRVLSFGEMR